MAGLPWLWNQAQGPRSRCSDSPLALLSPPDPVPFAPGSWGQPPAVSPSPSHTCPTLDSWTWKLRPPDPPPGPARPPDALGSSHPHSLGRSGFLGWASQPAPATGPPGNTGPDPPHGTSHGSGDRWYPEPETFKPQGMADSSQPCLPHRVARALPAGGRSELQRILTPRPTGSWRSSQTRLPAHATSLHPPATCPLINQPFQLPTVKAGLPEPGLLGFNPQWPQTASTQLPQRSTVVLREKATPAIP